MIVTFDKDYLRELYENGKGDKKHRFQPEVIRKYQICIRYLLGANNIRALFTVHSLHYDVLSGDKAGISSIRVNKPIPYRIYCRGARHRNYRHRVQYIRVVQPL